MPNLWDNQPRGRSQSELNPLYNPLLEKHLARWAKVYFSNPPGKREEAVGRLLDEIRLEISRQAAGAASKLPQDSDRSSRASNEGADVICRTCGHRNPPGHKFCGQCGLGLSAGAPPLRAPGPEIAIPPSSTVQHTEAEMPELQWLRDRTLGGFAPSEKKSWAGWKYLAGAAAVALAGFTYLQFVAHPGPAATEQTRSAPSPPVQTPSDSASSLNPPPTQPPVGDSSPNVTASLAKTEDAASPASGLRERVNGRPEGTRPGAVEPALQRSPLQTGPALDGKPPEMRGATDLRLAQQYLDRQNGERDAAEAARLLWKAVQQQNQPAAILLSDLYARGDGVIRNCEQARLLLLAPAKHGNREAAERLRTLESRGCP